MTDDCRRRARVGSRCFGGRTSAGRAGAPWPTCAVLLVAVLAASCATPTPAPTGKGPDPATLAQERETAARALGTFQVRGGLSVWNDEESVTARVDWRQRGTARAIDFAGPLGIGRARLDSVPGRATLTRGTAAPVVGVSADDVLRRGLGLAVPVPLEQLAAWVRGLPGDGNNVRYDERGRLESLRWRDAGGTSWQARVLRWTTLEGLELPSLISAQGSGYRLRLVLRDWSSQLPTIASSQDLPGGELQEAAAAGNPATVAPEAAATAEQAPRRRAIPGR